MRRPGILVGCIAAFLLGTIGSATADSNRDDNRKKFRAELKGFEEIPTLSTPGTGRFEARLSHDGQSVDYVLEYENTETNVRQAHIHLGAPAFNGSLNGFGALTTFASAVGAWTPTGAGQSRDYRVTYTLSAAAPNSVQNSNASLTLVWEAQNI